MDIRLGQKYRKGVNTIAKVRSISVTVGFTRSYDYQTVRYELSETIDLEEGDDAEAVIAEVRADLAKQVSEYTQGRLRELVVQARQHAK